MKLAITLGKVALISASLLLLFSCDQNKNEDPSNYEVESVTFNINRADRVLESDGASFSFIS